METQAKIFINENNIIELITYDYSHNKYKEVLEEAYKKNLRQIIFTTTIYKKLIEKTFQEKMYLVNVDFMDSLYEADFEDIMQLIREINTSNGNDFLVEALLKEIDWFANNESVDIKSVSILDRSNGEKVDIYNNGVILGKANQLEKIKSKLLTILKV